jgi:hypothetical protein
MINFGLQCVRPKAYWATKYNKGFSSDLLRNTTDDFEAGWVHHQKQM